MKNGLKNIDWKKVGTFAGGVRLVQQVSRSFQARMQRRYTQTAQQQYFVLRSVL